jgi:hypothetical protein
MMFIASSNLDLDRWIECIERLQSLAFGTQEKVVWHERTPYKREGIGLGV